MSGPPPPAAGLHPDERREIEDWFLHHGLPHLAVEDDRPDGLLTRVRLAVLAVLVIAAAVIAPAAGADAVETVLIVLAVGVVAVVAYGVADFGVLSLLHHQARGTLTSLRTTGSGVLRAMPPLLAVLLFLSLSAETWQAFGTLEGWRFGAVLIAFGLLILAILLWGLGQERRDLYRPLSGDDPSGRARRTPAAPLVDRGVRPVDPPLRPIERLNVAVGLMVTLALRVVAVGAAVGLFFFVFGLLVVDRGLTAAWTGEDPHIYLTLTLSGREVVITEALVRVASLLGGFSALYFAGVSLVEPRNREQFLDDELERLGRVMAAWSYYRGALVSAPSGGAPPEPS